LEFGGRSNQDVGCSEISRQVMFAIAEHALRHNRAP
jgi:hypothetical protein